MTTRTAQGRHLLAPLDETKRIIQGVLSRAQERENMKIVGLTVLSNHYHLLLLPDSTDQVSRFMRYFNGNVARELNAYHGWEGPFWKGRYKSINVASTEEDQLARFRYLLAQGLKEDLVERVADWPGIHGGLLWEDATRREGVWYDRSSLYERRRSGETLDLEAVAELRTIELSPLPCWAGLSLDEVRERVREMVTRLEDEHADRRKAEGKGVVGPRRMREIDPLKTTKKLERRPAPRFHARSREAYRALRDAYNLFADEFQAAAERLKAGIRPYGFPPGSFPPGLPFVPHASPG